MDSTIRNILQTISLENKIRVLAAVESGSRAWGFPSTDSDYDVRFIYTHKLDWYLSLNEERDVIEYSTEDDLLDINGWELRKALRLLLKGNAAVYEWFQSPIVYSDENKFLKSAWAIAPSFYPLKAGLYHYLGLIKGVLEDLSAPSVKVKRSFYGFRAALAAHWIIDERSVPPMTYDELKAPRKDASELVLWMETLREEKTHKTEAFAVSPPEKLRSYLEETVVQGTSAFDSLPNPSADRSEIENFFKSLVLHRIS